MEKSRQNLGPTRPGHASTTDGEAESGLRGANLSEATTQPEDQGGKEQQLMEEVVERKNMIAAHERVVENKGAAGVDGVTVQDLKAYQKIHWPRIREELLTGTYAPKPVKRVMIPKPDGSERELGIPTAMDRMIQQAIAQVLSPIFEPRFSNHSYGFRPGRSAHQAILAAQELIEAGYDHVVDIDLEKFFDRVNHDKLMGQLAKVVKDKRLLRVIRAFLNAGIMANGVVVDREEGTPQGGPLSPLLSNIVLDELDQELEARGHRFVRYADDCNVFVRSQKAGERTMAGLTQFIERRLKLRINQEKSAVARPWERKFLGYSFSKRT